MKNITIALKIFLLMTVVTGILYPLTITGFAQLIFNSKANGSFIIKENKVVGSELIGQQFNKPEFFWGRPSAIGNNPLPSGGSNLSPVSKEFKAQFQSRVDTIRKYHGNINIKDIPKDLLFVSASGVDPHISPEAAFFQIDRISNIRHFNIEQKHRLNDIVSKSIEPPDFFIFGEKRVNILKLNLILENF